MKQYLLGGLDPLYFFALIIFALFGAILSMLLQTTRRNVESRATPKHFSWMFFIEDNWKRVLTGLILILAFLRFTEALTGLQINEFVAFVIGFGNDKLAEMLKDKTNLLGQKKES